VIETTQFYSFEDREKLDKALAALAQFDPTLYDIRGVEGQNLHVWFADVETVMVPFCATVFPQAEDSTDPQTP
jgi:hypothetical protein